MYEGDEINSGDGGSFDRPGAIVSSSPDEQQNAEPVKTPKAPKPSKAEEPAPMFFQEPAPSIASPARTERNRSKKPLLIGMSVVAVLAVVAVVVVVVLITNNKAIVDDPKVAGRVNLAGLFDKDAPIPYRTTKIAKYGYVNPNTSEWVIPRVYDTVGPFYGQYAKVRQDETYMVINRKGEVVVESKNGAKIDYDIDENVWTVGKDIYNGEFQKANPDNSTASNLGYGYASVIPLENNDKNTAFSSGIPYIIKIENAERIYDCGKVGCDYILSYGRSDDDIYAIVHYFAKETKIINLKDGKELYVAPSNNKIAKQSDGVFAEISSKNKKIVQYIIVDNNQVSTSGSKPSDDYKKSISHSGKYFKETCDDKKGFKIIDGSNKEVVSCGIEKMWELSKNTYKRMAIDDKEAVIILKDDGAHLFNLKDNKDIKVYSGVYDVKVYENSAFIQITLRKGKKQMCNIFEPDLECVTVKDDPIVFSTFFSDGKKIYSYGLKVMSNED